MTHQELEDMADSYALIDRLSDLLHRTAIALKGPEPKLVRWSWHDLPELAARLRERAQRGDAI